MTVLTTQRRALQFTKSGENMKKFTKKILVCALLPLMIASCTLTFSGCQSKMQPQYYNLDTETLRVGIISDTQLTENYDSYAQNLEKALTYLKNRGTDVLIFGGDYSDLGTQKAADRFKSVYDGVFGNDKPISVAVMGNHDYWLGNFFDCWEIPFKSKMRKRLEGIFDDNYINVKVINGYTFFAFSPEDGSMDGKYDIELARKVLDDAVQRTPDKPIFVVTHQNPSDTIRGSQAWGNSQLNELFKNYPNVLSISGHSHYSMLDETNVMQTDYTAIASQSLSYIDFDYGYEPVALTADIQANPMLMYMTVKNNDVSVERIFVNDGKEYNPDGRYVFSFPYDKNTALYTQARKDSAGNPYFENFSGGITDYEGQKCISVTAAKHSGLVTEYRMRFLSDGNAVNFKRSGKQTDTLKYYSDFFQGYNAPQLRFAIPSDLPSGAYTVELWALESFGNESEKVTFNINI